MGFEGKAAVGHGFTAAIKNPQPYGMRLAKVSSGST
jgi:hypothetical protein